MSSSDPPFHSIVIAGLGLIGGSIALAVRERWPSCHIAGIDRTPVLDRAVARGVIDAPVADVGGIDRADLVVLAAPVGTNIELLDRLGRHLATSAVVTDVGSTKRAIADAAQRLPAHLVFVGGHPLAGAAQGGIESARADLFAARRWIFTPIAESTEHQQAAARLFALAEAVGATPITMPAGEHDVLMAFLSHLPQLSASALMHVVGSRSGEDGLMLAGPGLIDTTRLASSPSNVWRDICASNADAIGPALDLLIDRLQQIRRNLDRPEAVDSFFDEAGRWRSALMKGRE